MSRTKRIETTALVIAIVALLLGVGITAWHTVLFNQVDQRVLREESNFSQSFLTLESRVGLLNDTAEYQQLELDMLSATGNVTILEMGVCHLIYGKINFLDDVLADKVDTSQLVNYTVYRRDNMLHAVFSNFSNAVAVTSYPFDRMLNPTFPECDNSFPEFVNLVSIAFAGCTQDLTGQTFTQSLLNDVQLIHSRNFIFQTEQNKFEIANNTQKFFGPVQWWYYPPQCYRNQYNVYYNEIFFIGPLTNTYIFNIAIANTTTSMRITEPVTLMLTSAFQ